MAFVLRKPPDLSPKMEAFPYQMEAVRAVQNCPYAAIFHEQGLGKTKMAIDIALHWLERDISDTIFIVTKKSLVKNWDDEIKIHSHLRPRVLSDNRRANSHALDAPVLIYILNYEVCLSNFDLIKMFQKTCRVSAILDESQKIKNPEAKLTESFLELADGFVRKIIMTGTPVANRPYDLWSQIKFLDGGKSLGEDFDIFKAQTDIPDGKIDHEYGDVLEGINQKIKGFSIRETKKSSGIDLPEKTILTHKVIMSAEQLRIYESYRDDLCLEVKNEFGNFTDRADEILKRLLRLVQCASNPFLVDQSYSEEPAKFIKLKQLLEEEIGGRKAIIWTSFIDNAEWLAKKLSDRSPAIVHGSIGIDRRNEDIDRFKLDSDCKILVATPGAAKEGLTLTVANHSVFYDRSFSLDDYLQAQDRIHRISQKEHCFIHNILAEDTIDEWIDRLLYAKHMVAQVAQGDIKGNQGEDLYELDLSEMLNSVLYPKKHEGEEIYD